MTKPHWERELTTEEKLISEFVNNGANRKRTLTEIINQFTETIPKKDMLNILGDLITKTPYHFKAENGKNGEPIYEATNVMMPPKKEDKA